MSDPVAAALALVDALERADVTTAEGLLGPQRVANLRDRHNWTVEDYIHKDWRPALAELTGSPRQVVKVTRVRPNGSAYLKVSGFDETGLGSFGVAGDLRDGIQIIYIHCPPQSRANVAAFYAALTRAFQ